MRSKLLESKEVDPYWKTRALAGIDFAKKNWEVLSHLAEKYNAVQDAQLSTENAAGIVTPYRAGYVYHPQDVDDALSAPAVIGGGGGTNSKFRQMRTYDDYASSIAAGVDPHTLNAPDLMETRLGLGRDRLVNDRAWLEVLRSIEGSDNGLPVAASMEVVHRPDGTSYSKPPDGYHP